MFDMDVVEIIPKIKVQNENKLESPVVFEKLMEFSDFVASEVVIFTEFLVSTFFSKFPIQEIKRNGYWNRKPNERNWS